MAVNDHDWAVVISVSGYEGATAQPPWVTNLKGPDNDAAAIAEWLISPEGGGLPADNVLRVPSPFAPVAPFVHASLAPGEDEDEVMRRLTTSLLAPRSALEDFRMVEPA